MEKHHIPAQVAAGDDHHECKWSICTSWQKEKHHQRKLHSVKTISGTSLLEQDAAIYTDTIETMSK